MNLLSVTFRKKFIFSSQLITYIYIYILLQLAHIYFVISESFHVIPIQYMTSYTVLAYITNTTHRGTNICVDKATM